MKLHANEMICIRKVNRWENLSSKLPFEVLTMMIGFCHTQVNCAPNFSSLIQERKFALRKVV